MVALVLLAMADFVVILDASIVNIALTSIGRGLHISLANLSWDAANATMIAAGAAIIGLFYFLSLYVQKVLGYSAIKAGTSQLPLAAAIVVAAAIAAPLVARLGLGGC